MPSSRAACTLLLLASLAAPTVAASAPIAIDVDLREAPRSLVHAKLTIPASPGSLTLVYPKWIPGEHGPSGPIRDLAGVRFRAGGADLAWQRDPLDMYAFRLEVPAGADAVEASLDYLAPVVAANFTAGRSTTAALAVLSWNTVALYPQGASPEQLSFAPSVTLPDGWRYGTALEGATESGATVRFVPVSLVRLVDSPLVASANFTRVELPGSDRPHAIDVVADSPGALTLPPGFADAYARLVGEAGALFGARHYRHYDWLLTLSDNVEHFGLEHHESSDNRLGERTLLEEPWRKALASLLAHEYVHSWNGKYRRPAGLVREDYQQPFDTGLLWVYEGLTQYLRELLPARAGLWSDEYGRERLALIAANLEYQAGRRWRPLQDTAAAAQVLFGVPSYWRSWRRAADFYDESVLIWMEVDARLRSGSNDARSLDDFCRAFYGGAEHLETLEVTGPEVRPYGFDDVVAALSGVGAGDWKALLEERLSSKSEHAPLAGLEAAGWKLVFDDKPNAALADRQTLDGGRDLSYSLGIDVDKEGAVRDVRVGSPADLAGVAPGAKLVAVDGLAWSVDRLTDAVTASAQRQGPIELLVRQGELFRTHRVDYHGGARYPHLVRTAGADLLTAMQAPRVRPAAAGRRGGAAR
jgi:predicted metalloprotease with PDZ domain